MASNALWQRSWGWKVVLYLFLAGLGSGSFAVGAIEAFSSAQSFVANLGIIAGTFLVLLGTLFLLWDLGRPTRSIFALRRLRVSWISRGTWILTLFILFGALNSILRLTAGNGSLPEFQPVLDGLGVLLAIGVAAYTGVMLALMSGRPMWNSSILPALFITSAFSTGIGLLVALVSLPGNQTPFEAMEKWIGADIVSILLELLLIYFYLSVNFARAPESVRMVTRGSLAGPFWLGVLGAGLLIPLGLEYLNLTGGGSPVLGFVSGVGLLTGGLALRYIVVFAGGRAPVLAGNIRFLVRPGV